MPFVLIAKWHCQKPSDLVVIEGKFHPDFEGSTKEFYELWTSVAKS